jgi:hypothetical protein
VTSKARGPFLHSNWCFYEKGEHVSYGPNQKTFESEKEVIESFSRTTVMSQVCPKQTRTSGDPVQEGK